MTGLYPEPYDLSMCEIPDRHGDPLLEGDQAVVDLIVEVAYNSWWQMGSTHTAAPCARSLSARLMHPLPGDPVYVPDSRRNWRSADDRRKGVGYLIVARQELEGQIDESVFYVQYGPDPGDVCRWENATVMAIPLGAEMMRQIDEGARAFL